MYCFCRTMEYSEDGRHRHQVFVVAFLIGLLVREVTSAVAADEPRVINPTGSCTPLKCTVSWNAGKKLWKSPVHFKKKSKKYIYKISNTVRSSKELFIYLGKKNLGLVIHKDKIIRISFKKSINKYAKSGRSKV